MFLRYGSIAWLGMWLVKQLRKENDELTKRLEYHIGTPQYQDLLADNERLNIELAGETERHENDWNQIRQLTEQIEAYRKYADYKEMWLDSETHNRQLREENAELQAKLKRYEEVAKRVREYSQLDKADRVWLFAPLADNSEEDILTTDKDEKWKHIKK